MTTTADQLVERRRRALGPAYRHFYEKPLYLVRGEDVWLYDEQGRKYLDCYNNVPSVGHCHPEVVATLTKQASTLNTHTRYLHHAIVEYAEMLADTLPGNLSVCSFVCTGTEANDLAYRIARAVTGNEGALVTANAYHGNSTLVSELSRECGGKRPAPDYVVDVEPPYTYRGPYGEDHPDYVDAYANFVDDAIDGLASKGYKPGMMIVDSIFDAKGILTPPPEYQQKVYEKVHAAGGLIVADEVQSGLTRLGDNMWGFMDSGVIPDIVTMGKPMGDGHPLAVVVTTPEIAAEFARETDYFNTFGGNPVSCAAGLAVLDVLEREKLQANALAVGNYLVEGLQQLAEKHEAIGDVRGSGFFLALELVEDRESKAPATIVTKRVVNDLRNRGLLTGSIGQGANILKLRCPMVFSQENADYALGIIDQSLAAAAS